MLHNYEYLSDATTGNADFNNKYIEYFIIVLLFVFSTYQAIHLFGYRVVPNPDFFGYFQTAADLLSFQLPSGHPADFRCVPVMGLLQNGLSCLIGGQYADLKAGWLLNTILHPFNIVLVWLVGKRIVGRHALWIAIIVSINPTVMTLIGDPSTETPFLFFVLLTFYFVYRQSRVSFVFASIASMTRQEGVALILVVFIMGVINCKDKREWMWVFIYAGLAIIPFAIWTWASIVCANSPSHIDHYSKLGMDDFYERMTSLKYVNMMWRDGFHNLYSIIAYKIPGSLVNFSKVLIFLCFAFGTGYGLWKRRWDVAALHIFLWPYVLVHSVHTVLNRHHVATYWILLIICLYGLQNGWRFIVNSDRVPKTFITILQSLLLILAIAYLGLLISNLPQVAGISKRFVFVPYGAGIVIVVIFLVRALLYKARYLLTDLLVSSLICCMVFSSQFSLVSTIGDGRKNLEFKKLGEWYNENAEPDERMVCTLSYTTYYFSSGSRDSFIKYGDIQAESPTDFVRRCYDLDVTYVAWDSKSGRKGISREHYYNKWRMGNIETLEKPQNMGFYEFITQIRVSEQKYINVFRLRRVEY